MEYGDESRLVGRVSSRGFEGIFFQNFVISGWEDMEVKANFASHVTFLILGRIWFLLNNGRNTWSRGTNRAWLERGG